MAHHTLYGTPFSLYTGKARSYLIKQHIPFEERTIGHPAFAAEIAPVIGRTIIPVLQATDGTIVQDGTDIIDWFEARGVARQSAYPKGPRQHIVALLLELFGGEGLLRPAMHFRWDFDETNLAFLKDQFSRFIFPQLPKAEREKVTEKAMGRMRMAGMAFGAVPDTFGVIETAYEEFLDALNDHFLAVPYALGGAPTMADYGLIAPLFAHLGRDPYPAQLMKQRAPAVYRWTERMNAHHDDCSDFIDPDLTLPADDALPETLLPVLKLIAQDYLPEVRAFIAFTNIWLDEQDSLEDGSVVGGKPGNRFIGMCEFELRGTKISAAVLPYRLYLLQRLQDAFDGQSLEDQQAVRDLFQGLGLSEFLTLRATRRVERRNHVEVWGA